VLVGNVVVDIVELTVIDLGGDVVSVGKADLDVVLVVAMPVIGLENFADNR
jgi:hypothetical protein